MSTEVIVSIIIAVAGGIAFVSQKFPLVYKHLSNYAMLTIAMLGLFWISAKVGGIEYNVDYLSTELEKGTELESVDGRISSLIEDWGGFKQAIYWTIGSIGYLYLLRLLPVLHDIEQAGKTLNTPPEIKRKKKKKK